LFVLAQTGYEPCPRAPHELLDEAVETPQGEDDTGFQLSGRDPSATMVVIEEFVVKIADRLQFPERHLFDRRCDSPD